jgi:hypothetical protein
VQTSSGGALARNGAVTLDTNNISFATCGVPPPVPTLAQWAMIGLAGLLLLAGGFALRGRRTTARAYGATF